MRFWPDIATRTHGDENTGGTRDVPPVAKAATDQGGGGALLGKLEAQVFRLGQLTRLYFGMPPHIIGLI